MKCTFGFCLLYKNFIKEKKEKELALITIPISSANRNGKRKDAWSINFNNCLLYKNFIKEKKKEKELALIAIPISSANRNGKRKDAWSINFNNEMYVWFVSII
jgi:hypothetical protein